MHIHLFKLIFVFCVNSNEICIRIRRMEIRPMSMSMAAVHKIFYLSYQQSRVTEIERERKGDGRVMYDCLQPIDIHLHLFIIIEIR